jgi:E3 ubiquitin-protein ligase SIAH1
MDVLSRAFNEELLKELECPVCMQYMVPPIKLCTNGHNICSRWRKSIQYCPTCRAELLEVRSVALENIARKVKYPCSNRRSGCLELFSIEHIAKHQDGCVYGKIKCPLQLIGKCTWNGLKNDLKEHAKAVHSIFIFYAPTFRATSLSTVVAIVSIFGELFTYHKKKNDGRLYCAVQLIGTSSEASKYKCVFTLRAANGVERISYTFLVQGYSEDFDTIFNSGKCLKIDEDNVKHFVEGNELNMTVTLSKV